MIAALAGRRIDATGANPPRFPLDQVDRVREELRALFQDRGVSALVSSAACGADLLALDAARSLGIRFRIVLPFNRRRFKETSVVDRGGDWGDTFDATVDAALAAGDLVVMGLPESDEAYARATAAILNEAGRLARGTPVLAVAVWELESRGAGDHTQQFLMAARQRRYPIVEINSRASSGASDPRTPSRHSA